MPFGTIVSQANNYEPRSLGVYSLSTLQFGDPSNEFRVNGASKGRDGLLRTSVTRILQKDVVIGSETVRKNLTVSLAITSPTSDFSAAEIDSLAEDIAIFITSGTVTRMMQGES